MSENILLYPLIIPSALAIIILLLSKKEAWVKELVAFGGVTANLVLAIIMFGKDLVFNTPWGGFGINLSLKLYNFSSFIFLAVAGFSFLIVLYSLVFMRGKPQRKFYYMFLLLTVAFVNGAVLANNLIVMLFFWEGLLGLLFGMIMTGGKKAYPTALKAFVLSGVADLCLMLGVGMTIYLANGDATMDKIHQLPMNFMGGFAFILMMIGATAKAGSMPFHTWIPDAAVDAPLPFMAFLPAALEKLLGIYLLARITLDLFDFQSGTTMSVVMMTLGAVTIILAVMMALIQKDYKRLLSYHAISQVGYMILGIGTALPIGIVGGLFHMINHAMYKSCLFLTGGSVEKQAGTTDLKKLGGLGKAMPITMICFVIAAAAISGVPPFNGFFSKELIFDAALESGPLFYIIALLGAFFTAASFLKLGHTVFFGQQSKEVKLIKESHWSMQLPMIILAGGCVLFGVYNPLPLQNLIEPILGNRLEHSFAGLPQNWLIVAISIGVLIFAVLNHMYGVKKTKSAIGAVDHIHYAPVLSNIYNAAELRYFDPYDISIRIMKVFAKCLWLIDRAIDWIYEVMVSSIIQFLSKGLRQSNNGSQTLYIIWALTGFAAITAIIVFLTVY